MSWLSNALGRDKKREQQQLREWQGAGPVKRFRDTTIEEGDRMQQRQADYDFSRNQYMQALQGGQAAFETSARSAVAAAMPQFNQQLEGVRANAIRRGVNNGELGTSYEGDLASAFQKNIANAIGGQALGLYNTQLGGYSDLYRTDLGASEASTNRYFDATASEMDRMDRDRERKQRQQLGWAGLGVDLVTGLFGPGGRWGRGGGGRGGTG